MGKDGASIILCISVQSACKPSSAENEMVHECLRTVSKVWEVAPLRQPFLEPLNPQVIFVVSQGRAHCSVLCSL